MANKEESRPEKGWGEGWGDIATKAVGAIVIAFLLGLGGWMLSMYGQLITLNLKIDQLTTAIAETKQTEQQARQNARDLDNLRFRVTALEERGREARTP